MNSLNAQSQDLSVAKVYPELILQAEEAISDEKWKEALSIYMEVFRSADHVLAKDAYNACQVAAMNKDNDFWGFYYNCAKAGIQREMLHANEHISQMVQKDTSYFQMVYKEGFEDYVAGIDPALRAEFISRFNLEQASKGKSDYAKVCEDNFQRIFKLAKSNRFPGENLIGADEFLGGSYVLATLLHYPYSYTKLKPYLIEAVRAGFISPHAACYLYGFNQTRTSVLYTADIPADHTNFKECYNMPFGKKSADLDAVNIFRKQAYLPTLETEQKLKAVASKYQLDFREGY